MERISPALALRRHIGEAVPAATAYLKEASREEVQTSIWLVGLSTGLAGLVSTRFDILTVLPPWAKVTLVFSLGLTIMSGLLHRMFYQRYEWAHHAHLLHMQARLWRGHEDVVAPRPLDDSWSLEIIVEELKRGLGASEEFVVGMKLTEPGQSVDWGRTIYKAEYDLWLQRDKAIREDVIQVVSAYVETNDNRGNIRKSFSGDHPDDLKAVAGRTEDLNNTRKSVNYLAGTCAVSFASAFAVLLGGMLLHLLGAV